MMVLGWGGGGGGGGDQNRMTMAQITFGGIYVWYNEHEPQKGNASVGYTLLESIKTRSFATITNVIGSAVN